MEAIKAPPYHRYILPAFLIFYVAALAAWGAGFSEGNFTNPDAYDYAQMGREIVRGHGMTTLQLFPRHIPFMQARGFLESGHIPNLNRYPLPTIANALFQIFFKDIVRAAVMQSGTWFLASLPLLFLLARRLTNSVVALISAVIYAANASAWSSSYNGMTESLATLLVLALACVIFVARASRWQHLAAGLVCGLALLTRTQLAFLFPLALVLLWFTVPRPARLRSGLWLTAGFLLVTGPWMIRNTALAGEPLFSFTTTRAFVLGADLNYPDLEMLLHGPVGTADVFRKYGPDILAKVSQNLWPNILNPVSWIGSPTFGLLIWLALACSRIIPDARRTREFILFRNCLLVLILVNFITVALVLLYDRFFEFLYPLVLVVGVQEGGSLLQAVVPARARRALMPAAAAILLAAGSLRAWDISTKYRAAEPADSAESKTFQILAERIEPGSVVASDFSHKITVYDDLLTVRLPVKPPELLEISHDFLPIDYVVFSAGIAAADPRTHSSMFGNYTAYQAFMRSAAFLDEFEFVEELPNGAVLYRRRN